MSTIASSSTQKGQLCFGEQLGSPHEHLPADPWQQEGVWCRILNSSNPSFARSGHGMGWGSISSLSQHRGAAQGSRVPTLAFSIRMLVLCPLVPSVLWPLPALRMLPMLPSLPTLFLSPAAWGKQGARQQLPRIGGDTGHRRPQQGPMCQHTDATEFPRDPSSHRQCISSLPPPSMHNTDRVTSVARDTQRAETQGEKGLL